MYKVWIEASPACGWIEYDYDTTYEKLENAEKKAKEAKAKGYKVRIEEAYRNLDTLFDKVMRIAEGGQHYTH